MPADLRIGPARSGSYSERVGFETKLSNVSARAAWGSRERIDWAGYAFFGLINHYLGYLGIGNIPWLTSTDWSLVGVSLASIWWDLGLAFILFLAALQDLSRDLYDAADVDGASAWQKLRLITLPQMKPVISMVVTLQLISTLRIFSQVYVMTDGGPASSSSSVIYYVYTMAIRRGLFGYAAAVSMMLFAVILLVTLVQRQLIRER